MRGSKNTTTGRKIFLYALGVGAVGGAAYFIHEYMKDKKEQRLIEEDTQSSNTIPGKPIIITKTVSAGGDSFPLKRGSKGARVTQLQQSLQKKLGTEAMARFTAIDGDFGPGTENALKAAGWPTVLTESDYNRYTGMVAPVPTSPINLANLLNSHSLSRNLSGVLSILAQLKSPLEYSAVNEIYKNLRPMGMNRTIVTDLLDYSFKNDLSAKEQIMNAFYSMGLKRSNSGTWSLSGLQVYRDLVTMTDTWVKDTYGQLIPVKKNTILGEEINISNGVTFFKAIDAGLYAVPTSQVKYA
jgi:peptidoglycan hydrolase-like protein with peptidoglycan-binding domain